MDMPLRCRPARLRNNPSRRKRAYTLGVEVLEDRCLLAAGYGVVNLVSNVPGLAAFTDASMANPWGMAFSPTGPFWFGENTSGVSDLLDGRGQQIPLVVTVPGVSGAIGAPTGVVFNGGPGFVVTENGVSGESEFLFCSEDGTISGWAPGVSMTQAVVAVDNSAAGAIYKGLAFATLPSGQSLLYAANFHNDTIDVFDESFHQVVRAGAFTDPGMPSGYAPFNIQAIGNLVYVTYAMQDAAAYDDAPGTGHGFIDVYDLAGNLVRRLASEGTLDSPWGLAMAPEDFGPFGGDLLVASNGAGTISAFNPTTGVYVGTLMNGSGQPIVVPGIWGLTFGNGHMGGDANTLFFDAGFNNDNDGLFGAVQGPGRLGADTGGAGTFDPAAPGERSDYPLPPIGGPAVQTDGGAYSGPTAVLLPLKSSSLVMVPTLCAVLQPGTTSPVAASAGSFVTTSLSRSGSATMLVASSASFSTDAFETLEESVQPSTFSLSAFLDVDTLRNDVDAQEAQQRSVTRAAPSTGRSLSAGVNARVDESLSHAPLHNAKPGSTSEQGSSLAPITDAPATDAPALAQASMLSFMPTSSGQAAPRDTMAGQMREGALALVLRSFLGIFGVSLAWGCFLKGRAHARSRAENTVSAPAETYALPKL